MSCCFQYASLPHEVNEVFNNVFAREGVEHVVTRDDVVHEYAGGFQPAVHLGLVHVQCPGEATDAEGGKIYLIGVHKACYFSFTAANIRRLFE